jgi:hypothetical protein
MLKFLIYDEDQPVSDFVLRNAHLLGADNIGVRGTIRFRDGMVTCEKRAAGPAALCLCYDLPEVGSLSLQTCLLPDRAEPYILTVELARHRLMLLLAKQEDWMLFDLPAEHPAMRRATLARTLFVKALNSADPAEAHRLGTDCLVAGIDASEELALAHADILYKRRLESGQFHRGVFGCGVSLSQQSDTLRNTLQNGFDYIMLPTPWRQLEPEEQQADFTDLDAWAEWAYRQRMPILAGPVLSLDPVVTPDWLAVVEHDYDSVRDILYEHVERLVTRYRNVVTLWNVVSGIHVNQGFDLTLDQLLDLTRMSIMLVRKIQPNAKTLIEITHPFGEYYADNARSIPPMIYADMVLQAGIPIDAFGVRIVMGRAADGQYTRDLMQLSAMLDRFNGLGKPVHVTGVAVPSEPNEATVPPLSNGNGNGEVGTPSLPPDGHSGYWRKPWSSLVQSHWLEAIYAIALSKPFIDSVSWLHLADHDSALLPNGGLAHEDLRAKGAFHRIAALRKSLHAEAAAARNAATT